MKLANSLTSLLLLATVALADDATILRDWIAAQPNRDTGGLVQTLAARQQTGSTNIVSTVTRADPFTARLETFVRTQAATVGISRTSTFAQMESAWQTYIAAGSTVPIRTDRASDKARWFAFYALIRTLEASGTETEIITNALPVWSGPLWQTLGLSREPNGDAVEAAQR